MLKKGDKVRYRNSVAGKTFIVMKIRGKWVTIGTRRGNGVD